MVLPFIRGLSATLALFALFADTGCSAGSAAPSPQNYSSTPLPSGTASSSARATRSSNAALSASERTRLSRALDGALGTNAARFSLSIRDLTTGSSFTYHPGVRVATASIIKVDFLIGLLLRAQKEDRGLTTAEKNLAQPMIHVSSNEAATAIFDEIGGYSAFNATNRELGLKDTTDGTSGWGTTRTSAKDQIKVLEGLTSSHSPLTAASRRYVLDLMEHVASDENWGVSAASAPGEPFAVKVGVLSRAADDYTWIVNCIGRVMNGGHTFLIAAISDQNADEQGGKDRIEKASTLAVSVLLTAEK
jgi:Beta-lactamase enzyme family